LNHPSTGRASEPQPAAAADDAHDEAAPSDFALTRPEGEQNDDTQWWPESADGQCSESAALFAASQPAPLNVV